MAAATGDDFVYVNPELKQDEAEAPKSTIPSNPYIDENLIEAQKKYNPDQNNTFEQKFDIIEKEKKSKSNKQEMHPFSKKIMNGEDNQVLCMIRRDRAPNPVVYRVKYKNNKKDDGFDTSTPIEMFW
eukprot:CAMPEP_0201579398 /NCGR_PEP_ID=MMETSP0190_2-20130828/26928_1 /ASSEMBLY_ACC=CAM_ASM_000263 /TAXON_ID=37353 /ORGANISM="Rosalina sp." /LENGTH=126 /DNA_ID=CAMNT_0048013773 /DNA_START=20 /DNA_END=397 /DNA_ORIENTATION=+